jgi:citronellol/citronellal dehydrogenase
MCVLGMSGEFKSAGIAFNALWPRTTIATAAINNLLGGAQMMKSSRKPEIMADAAYVIFNRPSRECTGNFFIDDDVLASAGKTDLSEYAVDPTQKLMPDFFV